MPSVGDWSNSIFNPSIPHIDYNTTDGETVDSDLGAIVLEILDEDGKAVPGSVFEIDGVRAHRTMKSYVYDKDFGMYSQFTTDDNGKVVIRDVPYGTYTVHFVGSPDGSTVTETTKTIAVDEEIAVSQNYMHRNMAVSTSSMDVNLTDNILISPSGYTYWDLYGYYVSKVGIPLTWDDSAGGYISSEISGVGVQKKDNNTLLCYSNGSDQPYELKKNSAGTFTMVRRTTEMEEADGIFEVQENPDGTITATTPRDNAVTLAKNESGCYSLPSGSYADICKQGNVYVTAPRGADTSFAYIPIRYNEKTGKYIYDDVAAILEIIEADDTKMLLLLGEPVQYDQDFGVWTVFDMGAQVVLSNESVTDEIQATLASFKAVAPTPSDSTQPDEAQPINPQTVDAVLPAIVAIIAFTSGAFVAVKRNASR